MCGALQLHVRSCKRGSAQGSSTSTKQPDNGNARRIEDLRAQCLAPETELWTIWDALHSSYRGEGNSANGTATLSSHGFCCILSRQTTTCIFYSQISSMVRETSSMSLLNEDGRGGYFEIYRGVTLLSVAYYDLTFYSKICSRCLANN